MAPRYPFEKPKTPKRAYRGRPYDEANEGLREWEKRKPKITFQERAKRIATESSDAGESHLEQERADIRRQNEEGRKNNQEKREAERRQHEIDQQLLKVQRLREAEEARIRYEERLRQKAEEKAAQERMRREREQLSELVLEDFTARSMNRNPFDFKGFRPIENNWDVAELRRELESYGIPANMVSDKQLYEIMGNHRPFTDAERRAFAQIAPDKNIDELSPRELYAAVGPYDRNAWRDYDILAQRYSPEVADMMLTQTGDFNGTVRRLAGDYGTVNPKMMEALRDGRLPEEHFRYMSRGNAQDIDDYLYMLEKMSPQSKYSEVRKNLDYYNNYGTRSKELVDALNQLNYFGYSRNLPNNDMEKLESFLYNFASPSEARRFNLENSQGIQEYLDYALGLGSPYVDANPFLQTALLFPKDYMDVSYKTDTKSIGNLYARYKENPLVNPARGLYIPRAHKPNTAELDPNIDRSKLWAYKQLFGEKFNPSSGVPKLDNADDVDLLQLAHEKAATMQGLMEEAKYADDYQYADLVRKEMELFGIQQPYDTYLGRQRLLDETGIYSTRGIRRPAPAIGAEMNPFIDQLWGRAARTDEVPTMTWGELMTKRKEDLPMFNFPRRKTPFTGTDGTPRNIVTDNDIYSLYKQARGYDYAGGAVDYSGPSPELSQAYAKKLGLNEQLMRILGNMPED